MPVNVWVTKPSRQVLMPEYSRQTRSISWVLMTWLLASPSHQQSWYCISIRGMDCLRKTNLWLPEEGFEMCDRIKECAYKYDDVRFKRTSRTKIIKLFRFEKKFHLMHCYTFKITLTHYVLRTCGEVSRYSKCVAKMYHFCICAGYIGMMSTI